MAQGEVDFIIPFAFLSARTRAERSREFPDIRYETYYTWMDMTKFKWTEGKGVDVAPTFFTIFIKRKTYKYLHDNDRLTKRPSLEWVHDSNTGHPSHYFHRISAWQANLKTPNEDNAKIETISSKYIVGEFANPDGS